jgi:ribosome-binding factor A
MKRTRSHSAPAGQRQLRVAEQIRHQIADILQHGGFRDPELAESYRVTVTAVEIGPDLKHATAFVMPLGGDKADMYVAALNRAAGYFRSELAERIDLRYAPKVTFKIDHSFDEAQRINTLLRQERVQKDLMKDEDGA